jgi:hypothetical protein
MTKPTIVLTVRIANYTTGDQVGLDLPMPADLSSLVLGDVIRDIEGKLPILVDGAIRKFGKK